MLKRDKELVEQQINTVVDKDDQYYTWQGDKVNIYYPIYCVEQIEFALCNRYDQLTELRQQAIDIWHKVGSTRIVREGNIEYMVIWMEGEPWAKFEIYPDIDYIERENRQPVKREIWAVDRDTLVIDIINQVENEADVAGLCILNVITQYKGHGDSRRVCLNLERQIISMIGIKDKIHKARECGFTTSEIRELLEVPKKHIDLLLSEVKQ